MREYCKNLNFKPLTETNPELCKHLVNQNDAFEYSIGTGVKLLWKCQDCGEEFYRQPINMKAGFFYCKGCDDGYSFPNKVCFNLLKELNVDFCPEKTFPWCTFGSKKRYYYDFYIEKNNAIIEMMGDQHFNKCCFFNKRASYNIAERDILKKDLAYKNGIENYFSVDARISDFDFIKKSLIFDLKDMFDMSSVDWDIVLTSSLKSKIRECCEYFVNNPNKSTKEISKDLMLSKNTVTEYLKRGNSAGWCVYSGIIGQRRGGEIRSKKRRLLQEDILLDICSKYTGGKAIAEIAADVNKDRGTVKRLLKVASNEGLCFYDPLNPNRVDKVKQDSVDDKSIMSNIFNCLKTNPEFSAKKVAETLNINIKTVRRYIKIGLTAGLCEYDSYKIRSITKIGVGGVEVSQFSLNGEFIQNFNSLVSAGNSINRTAGAIHSAINGNTDTCGGFIWRYKDVMDEDEVKKHVRERVNTKWDCRKKEVLQFDLNGNFLKSYKCVEHAIKEYGQGIKDALRGKTFYSHGFLWRYSNTEYKESIAEHIKNHPQRNVKSWKYKNKEE